jgi:hypothetical protein
MGPSSHLPSFLTLLPATINRHTSHILAMKPKDIYVLSDFTEHANKSSPDGFAAFKSLGDLRFSTQTYIDENQAAHQVDMLLVGHYWSKRGGPVTWACATGTTVHYFYGNPFETMCKPVPEYRRSRIYFDSSFSTVAAPQYTGNGSSVWRETRTAGFHISEAVINYVFLSTGRLEQVQNCENVDMLSNFEYACAAAASQATDMIGHIRSGPEEAGAADYSPMVLISDKKRKLIPEQPRIKEEIDVANDMGAHRFHKGMLYCPMLHTIP